MQAESSLRRDDAATPVDGDALAEGLMLVRASTLKMIRLQLAMERRDRRVAIEAVDDLVALDRRLERYLSHGPWPAGRLDAELESERAALNREKLTLAAEVIRPVASPSEPIAEPVIEQDVAPDAEPELVWDDYADEDETGSGWRWLWVAACLAILAVAAVAASMMWGGL